MPNVGAIVRQLRIERDWSQEELAAKIGKTKQLVSAIEKGGIASTSIENIEALAKAFGESPLIFFSVANGTKEPFPLDDPDFFPYLRMAVRAYRCGMKWQPLEGIVSAYESIKA